MALGLTVADVNCDQWERTNDGVWRTESTATILFTNGSTATLSRADVRERRSDLYQSLEYLCRMEIHGGV